MKKLVTILILFSGISEAKKKLTPDKAKKLQSIIENTFEKEELFSNMKKEEWLTEALLADSNVIFSRIEAQCNKRYNKFLIDKSSWNLINFLHKEKTACITGIISIFNTLYSKNPTYIKRLKEGHSNFMKEIKSDR